MSISENKMAGLPCIPTNYATPCSACLPVPTLDALLGGPWLMIIWLPQPTTKGKYIFKKLKKRIFGANQIYFGHNQLQQANIFERKGLQSTFYKTKLLHSNIFES